MVGSVGHGPPNSCEPEPEITTTHLAHPKCLLPKCLLAVGQSHSCNFPMKTCILRIDLTRVELTVV